MKFKKNGRVKTHWDTRHKRVLNITRMDSGSGGELMQFDDGECLYTDKGRGWEYGDAWLAPPRIR